MTVSEFWKNKIESNQDWILSQGQEMTFRKGQNTFYEGHQPYGIFLLISGNIKFSNKAKSCSENHFWRCGSKKIIGLEFLENGTPFCFSCRATSDCSVIFLSKTSLSEMEKF